MNLDQLQQQLKELEKMNLTQSSPEQMSALFEKLTFILEQSELSFLSSTLTENNNQQNTENNESDSE